jgi:thiamine biosynthesis lipoprotein
MNSVEFLAMGSRMTAITDGDSPSAAARLDQVSHWFDVWEDRLSRFRADSELSLLNRSAGRPVPVSGVLWEAMRAALWAAGFTDGLVTPTMAPQLAAAGYDRSFELMGEWSDGTAAPPPPAADWRAIRMDPATRSVTVPVGYSLDLGGTAKGWSADRALHRLRAHGAALVDAGGDIALHGPRQGGEGWPVGVADPAEPGRSLELLSLLRGGVATSGRDYHRWFRDGQWLHHILDPRSGLPATTDVVSATVVAPTTLQAEAAAKVVLILGSQSGMTWLEARPSLAGLAVLEGGRLVRSRRLSRYVWR